MSNKSLLSWKSSSLDWKTWNTCQNLDLSLIIVFLVRILALSLNFAIWILCWAFACDRDVFTRLYASEVMVVRAGLTTDWSNATHFFISIPEFECAILYILIRNSSFFTFLHRKVCNKTATCHPKKKKEWVIDRLNFEDFYFILTCWCYLFK